MEALGGISAIITIIDTVVKLTVLYGEVKGASEEITHLKTCVESLSVILKSLYKLLEDRHAKRHLKTLQELQPALDSSQSRLQEVNDRLQKSLDATVPGGRRTRLRERFGISKSSLKWPFQSKEIKGIVESLYRHQTTFASALEIDLAAQRFEENQKAVLARLPIARGATFDSQANENEPRCHSDTRKNILARISEWNSDPGERCIFWLCGMAGTGKSTICRTVAASLHEKGAPAASYFFKKGEGDRGTASRFFTTIAMQIIQQVPAIAATVQETLEAEPNLVDKGKKEQFERLILHPLESCKDRPDRLPEVITVVVDALDECEPSEDARAIIRLFSVAKETLKSVRLRFFVTSRPDAPIRLGFKDVGDRYTDLTLHEVPRPDIENDIRNYLEWRLVEIRKEFNKKSTFSQLSSDWPSPESTRHLVELAVPLFIFAATACRFIADSDIRSPQEQLEQMLSFSKETGSFQLRATYLPVLDQLLLERTIRGWEERSQRDRKSIVCTFRQVVGVIVLLAEPLSTGSLAGLLKTTIMEIETRLAGLHSILHIPKDPFAPVKLLHLSFRDFLVDPECRQSNLFWVDERQTQADITSHCLTLLSSDATLRRDILSLKLPGYHRSNLSAAEIDRGLPQEVQYACRYWTYHLKQGQHKLQDDDICHVFLKRHLLHWLEVLALIGRIREVQCMIEDLLSLVDNTRGISVTGLLRDVRRFVMTNRQVMDEHPLQIYHSSLMFLPAKSVIRRVFQDHYPSYLSAPLQIDVQDALLQSFESQSDVLAVAFSWNNRLSASVSAESVEVWNLLTGTSVLNTSTPAWISKAQSWMEFTSDDRNLVITASLVTDTSDGERSVSRVLVYMIDIATGGWATLWDDENASDALVSFSGGKWLAIVTEVGKETPEDINSVEDDDVDDGSNNSYRDSDEDNEGHCDGEGEDGKYEHDNNDDYSDEHCINDTEEECNLIYFIRLFDLEIGDVSKTLNIQLTDRIRNMAIISWADGPRLAVLTDDRISLWDLETGDCLKSIVLGIHASLSAFSANARWFAYGPEEGPIRVFDLTTESLDHSVELEIETVPIDRIALSPDGRQLAIWPESWDLHFLDVGTGDQRAFLPNMLFPIAFSPDGQLLAASSTHAYYVNICNVNETSVDTASASDTDHRGRTLTSFSSPSRDRFITLGDETHPAIYWDARAGNVSRVLARCLRQAARATFSQDGGILAFVSRNGPWVTNLDATLVIWDVKSDMAIIEDIRGLNEMRGCLTLSPHGTYLAYEFDRRSPVPNKCIQVCKTSRPMRELFYFTFDECGWISCVTFSADSRLLASSGTRFGIQIWDVTTGTCVRAFGPADGSYSISFLPGSTMLVTADECGSIKVWDIVQESQTAKIDLGDAFIHTKSLSIQRDLIIDSGRFSVDWSSLFSSPSQRRRGIIHQRAKHVGIGVSKDRSWIMWKEQKLVWLPPSYRGDDAGPFGHPVVAHSTVILQPETDVVTLLHVTISDPLIQFLNGIH